MIGKRENFSGLPIKIRLKLLLTQYAIDWLNLLDTLIEVCSLGILASDFSSSKAIRLQADYLAAVLNNRKERG